MLRSTSARGLDGPRRGRVSRGRQDQREGRPRLAVSSSQTVRTSGGTSIQSIKYTSPVAPSVPEPCKRTTPQGWTRWTWRARGRTRCARVNEKLPELLTCRNSGSSLCARGSDALSAGGSPRFCGSGAPGRPGLGVDGARRRRWRQQVDRACWSGCPAPLCWCGWHGRTVRPARDTSMIVPHHPLHWWRSALPILSAGQPTPSPMERL